MTDEPARPETIYLDNNATTAVDPEVFEAMRPFLTTEYFNPSSIYERAATASVAMKASRETVARSLGGVHPDEIVFTSCATESVSHAIRGSTGKQRMVVQRGRSHAAGSTRARRPPTSYSGSPPRRS